jgi:hypothetical protein
MKKKSTPEMFNTLRDLLREALVLRSDGASAARLARANGSVDGYMRALLHAGLVSERELLDLVARERAAIAGPATQVLNSETSVLAA